MFTEFTKMDVINNSVTGMKTEFSELIQYMPTRVSMAHVHLLKQFKTVL